MARVPRFAKALCRLLAHRRNGLLAQTTSSILSKMAHLTCDGKSDGEIGFGTAIRATRHPLRRARS